MRRECPRCAEVAGVARALVLMLAAGGIAGCAAAPERHEYRELHMGCEARVVLYATDAEEARGAARRAFDRIAELDRILSDWKETSEVSRLADRAADGGGPFAISGELEAILACSLELWRSTDGRFDPALGARTRLWRRVRAEGVAPGAAELEAAQRASGADAVTLGPGAVTFARAGVRFDFGAIGKGWAADAALDVLVREGIATALVAVAGDIALGDAPPGMDSWRVKIDATGETIDVAPWSGVSTSGDREQRLERGGTNHSHILDPRGGLGVVGAPEITVVVDGARSSGTCGAAALADALATALSVAPANERAAIIDRFPAARVRITPSAASTDPESRPDPAPVK